jgi:hypothetical protein
VSTGQILSDKRFASRRAAIFLIATISRIRATFWSALFTPQLPMVKETRAWNSSLLPSAAEVLHNLELQDWWMMNCKGSAIEQSSPVRGTIPAFAWRGWGKPRNISGRIADVPTEIRTEHIPNTCPEGYGYANCSASRDSNRDKVRGYKDSIIPLGNLTH